MLATALRWRRIQTFSPFSTKSRIWEAFRRNSLKVIVLKYFPFLAQLYRSAQ